MFPAGGWRGIVVAFDGSDHARCAARWAAREATRRQCPLHLVGAVEIPVPAMVAGWAPISLSADEDQRRLCENELRAEVDACRSMNGALPISAALYDGPLPGRLARHAKDVDADLIVVGGCDQSGLYRAVFGSTEAELVRTTHRPVVAVRRQTPVQEAAAAIGYAPVLAVCDDVATAARVLEFAFAVAERWSADVTVLAVAPRERGVLAPQGVPPRLLWRHVTTCRANHPTVPVRVSPVDEQPARSVLEHTEDAQLTIVGDRRQGVVHRLLAGSVSHTVLHNAPCTVMVV